MPRLVVEFTKMNGAGNDFIVIDNRFYHFSDDELSAIATQFCPRRLGIGADGLLALNIPSGDADFRMRYLNADGSIGTMCGNGARCLAMFAHRAGITGEPLRFETDAGPHVARVDVDRGVVRLGMVGPRDYRDAVSLGSDLPAAAYVWTGTEHAVLVVDDIDVVDVDSLGPAMRARSEFSPAGANVNFVECTEKAGVRVRTFEKGVEAETLACGTGAVASAVVAVTRGLADGPDVTVHMPGGDLVVSLDRAPDGSFGAVSLTGPAAVVFRGSFEF